MVKNNNISLQQIPSYFIGLEDFKKIDEIWGKEMIMVEFLWSCMSLSMQEEVDKAMREKLKTIN